MRDVLLRDRLLGTTQRISSGADATPCESNEPDITPDGRYVVFQSCAALAAPAVSAMAQIYRYDHISGEMLLVSRSAAGGAPHSASFTPRLSDDGNVVVFHSCATNLVAGGPTRDALYVRDIAATTAWRRSLDSCGAAVVHRRSGQRAGRKRADSARYCAKLEIRPTAERTHASQPFVYFGT